MKLIILDRDGVINYDSDDYIRTVEQWLAIPNSIAAIADLSHAGYKIAVATNQSGIGRGYYSLHTLAAMHEKMHSLVHSAGGVIDKVVFCPHLPDALCQCRKPLPGMLLDVIDSYPNLSEIYFVGDSLSDLKAANSAHITAALVLTGKGQRTLDAGGIAADVPVYADLAAFAKHIISQ
ncbi:MAG: D-glycero-D-manno-heptose 1,7-bisphosphate phosphatase [Oceanospirillaceae bacterium]|jgi:D-glycero-D-manno-heptose 1,7-bisphosphate phosphatase